MPWNVAVEMRAFIAAVTMPETELQQQVRGAMVMRCWWPRLAAALCVVVGASPAVACRMLGKSNSVSASFKQVCMHAAANA